jgi:hypothetical protein
LINIEKEHKILWLYNNIASIDLNNAIIITNMIGDKYTSSNFLVRKKLIKKKNKIWDSLYWRKFLLSLNSTNRNIVINTLHKKWREKSNKEKKELIEISKKFYSEIFFNSI